MRTVFFVIVSVILAGCSGLTMTRAGYVEYLQGFSYGKFVVENKGEWAFCFDFLNGEAILKLEEIYFYKVKESAERMPDVLDYSTREAFGNDIDVNTTRKYVELYGDRFMAGNLTAFQKDTCIRFANERKILLSYMKKK